MPSDLVASSSGADGTAQVAPSPPPVAPDATATPQDGRGPVLVVALALVVTVGAVIWMIVAGGDDSSTADTPVAEVAEGGPNEAAPPAPADVPVEDESIDVAATERELVEVAPASPPVDPVDETPVEEPPAVVAEDAEPPVSAPAEVDTAESTGQPQSRAAFRDGQVVLFGKVPSREIADEIFDLAASLLGPENVIDEYEIDPTVPAPTTGNLTVEETIEFSSGAAVLPDPVPDILPIGVALMTARPTTEMRIIGHTDGRGSEEANLRLSLDRANAVKAYLVEQGIDPARIETVGFGEAFPVAPDDTEEGRRQNRRIEFEVQNILGTG